MVGPGRAEPLDEDDPTSVGPYDLLGRLGDGGMGSVYLARRRPDPAAGIVGGGPLVALKVIRSDLARVAQFRERFVREAQAAQRVARFCTAEVIDVGMSGRRPFLVTEFIDGPTLFAAVRAGGPLPPAELERLAVAVASALTAIHAAGVIHRDLKPGNILLSPSGARVIDFGIARALDVTQTLTHGSIGTPGFMAPEQALGRPVTAAADVYAWGAVVVFAASGRPPFEADSTPVVLRRVVEDTPDLSAVHVALRPLVARAMAKEAAGRPSAEELLLALHRVAARPAGAPPGDETLPSAEGRPTPPPAAPARTRAFPSTPPPTPATPSGPGVLAGSEVGGQTQTYVTRMGGALGTTPGLGVGAGGPGGVAGARAGAGAGPASPVPRQPIPSAPVSPVAARGWRRRGSLAVVAAAVAVLVAGVVTTVVLVSGDGDGGGAAAPATGGSTSVVSTPGGPVEVGRVTAAHRDVIRSVAVTLDGRTAATGGDDDAVRLWDVSNRAEPVALGEAAGQVDDVRAVAFSQDGKLLAGGGADQSVRLWDVSDRAHPLPFSVQAPLDGWVNSVAFSPDGRVLAIGANDLWLVIDVTDGSRTQLVKVGGGGTSPVEQLAFDGGTLAVGYANGVVALWDVSDPASPRRLGDPLALTDRDPDNIVYGVAVSRLAEILAVGGLDATVRLWRLSDPVHPAALGVIAVPAAAGSGGGDPRAHGIWSVALSPDGKFLAAGSGARGVLVWSLADPSAPSQVGAELSHGAAVDALTFDADGGYLFTGDTAGTLRVWSLGG